MKLQQGTICVNFKLTADQRLVVLREDYCLYLDIDITRYDNLERHRHIKASRSFIEKFIKEINKFIEEDYNEVELSPMEEDFYLLIRPNKVSHKDVINGAKEANYSQWLIDELEASVPKFRLTILIDNSYAGLAYMIHVTKEDLSEFVNELERRYRELVVIRKKCFFAK